MYNELILIHNIQDLGTKAELLVTYIEEYSGWINQLENAGAEANAEEIAKAKAHVKELRCRLLNLIPARAAA